MVSEFCTHGDTTFSAHILSKTLLDRQNITIAGTLYYETLDLKEAGQGKLDRPSLFTLQQLAYIHHQ